MPKKDKAKAVTVHELIAALQRLPQDAYVLTEGCDCVGPCAGAKVYDGGCVLLLRDDSLEAPNGPS